jgi:hypothetical protein
MAMPKQMVVMGARMYCIVSYTANPAVTIPPGELMYKVNFPIRIFRFQIKKLGNDRVGRVRINRPAISSDKNNPVPQKPRVNIITNRRALVPALNDGRDHSGHVFLLLSRRGFRNLRVLN